MYYAQLTSLLRGCLRLRTLAPAHLEVSSFSPCTKTKKKTLLRGLLFFSLPPNNPRNPLPKAWLASSCSGPLHSVQPQHSTSSSSNLEPLCYLTHFPGAYSCTMAVILQGDRGVINTVHNYLDQVVFSYFCIKSLISSFFAIPQALAALLLEMIFQDQKTRCCVCMSHSQSLFIR